jgi:nucleoside-diphosphate-sugar epimerase
MNVVVTGGSGFVGSHLVERLLAEHHSVIVLDSFITGRASNLDHLLENPDLSVIDHDCTIPFSHLLSHSKVDWVFNLASPASPKGYAKYPIQTLRVNAEGSFNALTVALEHGARYLQASTSEVYGDPLVHPQPETYWGNVNPVGPRSCYDEGKRYAESLTMEFGRQHGLDVRIARIFNTYGPRSQPTDGRVVPNFCTQALAGEPLTVYGSGLQTRSFCYVDDLIEGIIRLIDTDGIGGEIVNLGNPVEHTILQFAERIIELTGGRSEIVFEQIPDDDPRQRKPDISRAHQLLKWTPTTDLSTGLRHTLDFFANRVLAGSDIANGEMR